MPPGEENLCTNSSSVGESNSRSSPSQNWSISARERDHHRFCQASTARAGQRPGGRGSSKSAAIQSAISHQHGEMVAGSVLAPLPRWGRSHRLDSHVGGWWARTLDRLVLCHRSSSRVGMASSCPTRPPRLCSTVGRVLSGRRIVASRSLFQAPSGTWGRTLAPALEAFERSVGDDHGARPT